MATFNHYQRSLANQNVRRRYARYCRSITIMDIAGSIMLFGLAGVVGWICMAIF